MAQKVPFIVAELGATLDNERLNSLARREFKSRPRLRSRRRAAPIGRFGGEIFGLQSGHGITA
jgi:hypothetical protein